MARRSKKNPPTPPRSPAVAAAPERSDRARRRVWFAVLAVLVALVAVFVARRQFQSASPTASNSRQVSPTTSPIIPPEAQTFAAYAGSASCRECHASAFDRWKDSHHALAERPVDPTLDRSAFEPKRAIAHGTQTAEARATTRGLELVTAGLDGRQQPFVPDRVIGLDPLRQFLIPTGGGRWQTAELAYDPRSNNWFNVFGDEDRKPGEWGHWTGRGMNWNMMCAACHNTRVRKNYRADTDTYATAMAERSVGCEACHGPQRAHVDWQKKHRGTGSKAPTAYRHTRDQSLATCGSCHARRGELTGDFQPGDDFFDHFSLTIPDETDLFYPDGQVRDEDYEFTSFLSSRMHTAGVRCVDCHEPHSSKTILPGNLLCLRCHAAPVGSATASMLSPPSAPAPVIVAAAHSHHAPDKPGGRCVDCHMPQTVYMQRHARHDHGFTIPDPLLTKQLGIPNACNRCHADRSTDWAIEAVDKWYGPRMNRPSRTRAQWIAAGRANRPGAEANLLRLLTDEKVPLWRAAAANLLRNWSHEPHVASALLHLAKDTNAIVRAAAARALETPAQTGNSAAAGLLQLLLADPVRNVRVEAAWSLRARVAAQSLAGRELRHMLEHNRDQPTGLLQLGQWFADRGDPAESLACLRRAVEWDAGSPPLQAALALALNAQGQTAEAVRHLETACRLAPRQAEYRFNLALGLNELGRLPEALAALEETVKLDPQFSRAWYNLGLAYNGRQQTERALDALVQAESLDPRSPQASYARATILARLGRTAEALTAARRALEIAPNHAEAAQLVRALAGGVK